MAENKLYVGNIPYSTTDDQLRELFTEVGPLDDIKIITDRFSGESRGFGFATFTNVDDAKQAIEKFNGYEFQGKTLKVNVAREPSRTGGGGRGGRTGGGGGGFRPRGGNGGGFRGGNHRGNE